VFHALKQSVSYGETKCFKLLKLPETNIRQKSSIYQRLIAI